MIEINLLPGPKKKKSAGPSLPFSMDDIKAVLATVKDPVLVGSMAALVVGVLILVFFWVGDSRRLATLVSDSTRVEAEQRRFAALIAQKRKAEQLRDSLVAELNVIRGIDGERFVWPHILEEVGRGLPDYTWLVAIQPDGVAPANPDGTPGNVRFKIEGRTSDIQAYTRFLRQLSSSPWLTNIVAGPTNATVEKDRPVTSFSLQAEFRHADSAYIRTAPVTQTIR
jgi:Tfp pilus assembly protein PilN